MTAQPAGQRPARITPATFDELPPDIRDLVQGSSTVIGGAADNLMGTLAKNPGLFRKFGPFGGKLLRAGKLPARDRELAILRTAWRVNCLYEWSQHVQIAGVEGMSRDEIDMCAGDLAGVPDADDRALLTAVDQLVSERDLSDENWQYLSGRFDEAQRIEFAVLVGAYAMLAGLMNSAGIQVEDTTAAFPGYPPSKRYFQAKTGCSKWATRVGRPCRATWQNW